VLLLLTSCCCVEVSADAPTPQSPVIIACLWILAPQTSTGQKELGIESPPSQRITSQLQSAEFFWKKDIGDFVATEPAY